jgi:hypothetical protein
MQTRAKVGVDFEKICETDGWVRKTKSPKLKWNGKGRNNITKIKNCDLDPSLFTLSEKSELSKYDIYNPTLDLYREVKRYQRDKLKSWIMYSEPYFKVASWSDMAKIDKDIYNKFVQDFWDFNQTTGLFDNVQKEINELSEGVQCVDGFIPKEELEFRTVIVKTAWKGYYRITIEFKLKNN